MIGKAVFVVEEAVFVARVREFQSCDVFVKGRNGICCHSESRRRGDEESQ